MNLKIELKPQQGYRAGGEDQEEVEDHIQTAHGGVEDTGGAHISGALEHIACQDAHEVEGDGHAEDHEVGLGAGNDFLFAAQPHRQMGADGYSKTSDQKTADQANDEGLAQDVFRLAASLRADELRHLHGETGGDSHAQTVEEPCGTGHKADGACGAGAETAHHGSIDVLHDGGADLSQNGRDTESDDERHHLP